MRKVLIALIAVCMLSAAVASPTGSSTCSLYTSETDDVLNVNNWSNVDVGNGFLFMNFYNDYSLPTVGYAKKLDGGLFIAGSVTGNYGSYKDSDYNTQTGKVDESVGESKVSLSANVLLGIADWGFKLSANFNPYTRTVDNYSSDPSEKTTTSKGSANFDISAGTSFAVGNGTLKPYAGITYSKNNYKVSSNKVPTDSPLYDNFNYDYGTSTLCFYGKADFLTASENGRQHRVGAYFSYSDTKYNDSDYAKLVTNVSQTDESTDIYFAPSYAFIYSPVSNVSFTAETELWISNVTQAIDKDKYSYTSVSLYENLGAFYKVTDKFQINGGVQVCGRGYTQENSFDGKTEDKKVTFGTTSGSGTTKYLYNQGISTTPYFGLSFDVTQNLKADVCVIGTRSLSVSYKF